MLSSADEFDLTDSCLSSVSFLSLVVVSGISVVVTGCVVWSPERASFRAPSKSTVDVYVLAMDAIAVDLLTSSRGLVLTVSLMSLVLVSLIVSFAG